MTPHDHQPRVEDQVTPRANNRICLLSGRLAELDLARVGIGWHSS